MTSNRSSYDRLVRWIVDPGYRKIRRIATRTLDHYDGTALTYYESNPRLVQALTQSRNPEARKAMLENHLLRRIHEKYDVVPNVVIRLVLSVKNSSVLITIAKLPTDRTS